MLHTIERLQKLAESDGATRPAQIVKINARARQLQGSLVAMDPTSRDVLALVGGGDDQPALQPRRRPAAQAGSAFKPIVFAAALERGFAPGTVLRDLGTPILSYGPSWLPSGEHERTEYHSAARSGFSSSHAAAQLMQQVGTSTTFVLREQLGIASPLPMVPSLGPRWARCCSNSRPRTALCQQRGGLDAAVVQRRHQRWNVALLQSGAAHARRD